MSWVGVLFRRVWTDDKMPLLEKLTLLDEASKAWPFATRIEYHKWRYQFKDEDEAGYFSLKNNPEDYSRLAARPVSVVKTWNWKLLKLTCISLSIYFILVSTSLF